MTPADLSRSLTWAADDLEGRWPYVGLLRQAARHLADLPAPSEHGCRGCDTPLTGRRQWCSERCRSRHRRR